MKKYILLIASAFSFSYSYAQNPTWADDVACIVYSHCTSCHRAGGIAPFSLIAYNDAYLVRNEMQQETQARFMPPWPPDEHYNSLAHERVLDQNEIDIIAAWVGAGAPEGNPANTPAPPVYTSNWEIPNPDISVVMDDYVVPATTDDLYRCFVLPITNPTDSYIHGIEVVPGNSEIVHHVLVYQDTTGQAAALDAQDIDPGYTSFGGIGVSDAVLTGIWVPGSKAYFTPQGMSLKLMAGADLVIQVHYPHGSVGQLDSTRVNIELGPQTLRTLRIDPILDHILTITNGPLVIPPDQVKTFHAEYTVPFNSTITAIGPHAHLICKSMNAFAVTPSNDTIPLIDIPYWDFHWQGLYDLRNPVQIPAGSTLHGYATYDNTVNNLNNPNSPPQWVWLGEATTDEMMLFYFSWTFYLPGDENIVIDTAQHATHHLNCTTDFAIGLEETPASPKVLVWPVPAHDQLWVEQPFANAQVRMLDAQGKLITSHSVPQGTSSIPVQQLAPGAYWCEVLDQDGRVAKRIQVLLQ